jgi:cytochrome P450
VVQASVRPATLSRTLVTDAPFLFPVALNLLALRPFTFSNGVTVPAGTIVAAPSSAIHTDGDIYPNPETFDGFRFAKLREHDGAPVVGQQATSTSAEYLAFGYGRHVW